MSRLSRAGIAVVLLAGVLWAGGVAQAKPEPVRGGSCERIGASRVSAGVTLRCAQTVKGTKVWRVVAVSTTTTSTAPTTTSTTPTTSSTTAVVMPSVSLSATSINGGTYPKSVTVTANVAGTIYFAEGDFVVKTVSDITSAPSHRWAKGTVTSANTPTSIAIAVDAVTNGYYRVFVANSQGVLSAPAINIVTISVTRASTATTTVALTCATGGVCALGETGPGGGKVFYVHATGTFACGATLSQTCKYLEAAPTTGNSAWTDVARTWATNANSNQTTAVSGADGTAIGTGYQNTSDIVAQSGNVAATSAAVEARAYRGPSSLSDWFLPSQLELNQLCRYAWNLTVDNTATTCTGMSGTIRAGFSTDLYWSSSENDPYVWLQDFLGGHQSYVTKNDYTPYVRPVRAF